MALPSHDLLEAVLEALTDWEGMLQRQFDGPDVEALDTNPRATVGQADELFASRVTNEDALAAAQRRRSDFLRSPAAKFVVPVPWSISYWYDEPKAINKNYLKKKSRGGAHNRLLHQSPKQKTLHLHLEKLTPSKDVPEEAEGE